MAERLREAVPLYIFHMACMHLVLFFSVTPLYLWQRMSRNGRNSPGHSKWPAFVATLCQHSSCQPVRTGWPHHRTGRPTGPAANTSLLIPQCIWSWRWAAASDCPTSASTGTWSWLWLSPLQLYLHQMASAKTTDTVRKESDVWFSLKSCLSNQATDPSTPALPTTLNVSFPKAIKWTSYFSTRYSLLLSNLML